MVKCSMSKKNRCVKSSSNNGKCDYNSNTRRCKKKIDNKKSKKVTTQNNKKSNKEKMFLTTKDINELLKSRTIDSKEKAIITKALKTLQHDPKYKNRYYSDIHSVKGHKKEINTLIKKKHLMSKEIFDLKMNYIKKTSVDNYSDLVEQARAKITNYLIYNIPIN